MKTTVAIHGSNGFARDWPDSAARLGLEVRRVDALGPTLWRDLEGCAALLWSVNHDEPTDLAFASHILQTVEKRGFAVFPNHRTVWHFDDKVAQKYLLEAIDAPLVDTWVFFSKREADAFLERASYPLVFKLRRGAGSMNVLLVRNVREGKRLAARMFGRGVRTFPLRGGVTRMIHRARQTRSGASSIFDRGRRAARALARKLVRPMRESGYVLFQRFVPENSQDIRVTVIGDRAFVFFRRVRPNDFRASGSGLIEYPEFDGIPLDIVQEAFAVSRAMGSQSLAMDFVRDPVDQRPLLLEVSFSFVSALVERCPGHVTPALEWREGSLRPADVILEDLLAGS